MICHDCKTPMVSIHHAARHGVPEGHRRHMGHGRCSGCIRAYRAAQAAQEAAQAPVEAARPFDPELARQDLTAWIRDRRRRLGQPLDAPVEGLDTLAIFG